jgi:UDP-glucose 4-epimerase
LDTAMLVENSRGAAGIFHCAALISVPESFEKKAEYERTNVEGTKSVLEVAKEGNMKVVFSSSAAVYGEASGVVNEGVKLDPKSPYAEQKKMGEELLALHPVPSVALRYFNVYGPGQSAAYAGVITIFISNALQGKDICIYGDGNQVRDFVYVDDVAEANIATMQWENKSYDVFNIGSGSETTIKDLAEMIIALTNSTSQIIYLPPRQGDIVYSRADVSKAKNILGWEAKVSLEEGLQKTIGFYQNRI